MATQQKTQNSHAERGVRRVRRYSQADRSGQRGYRIPAVTLQAAVDDPFTASPGSIRTLQHTYGNRAVSQLLQTKLTVGPVGDRYEQEADRIAKQVVTVPTPTGEPAVRRQTDEEELQMQPLATTITPITQRQAEEEELQMQSALQPQALDDEELQMQPDLQRQTEEEELQMQPAVQRQAEEEELQMQPDLQRQGLDEEELQMTRTQRSAAGGPVSRDVEAAIRSARGGGSPLDTRIRAKMETGFGVDFGGVRVHTDARADSLNRSLNARAFTTGQDIFFKSGVYNPHSAPGQELLAHELTHVVQQGGAQIKRTTATDSFALIQRDGSDSADPFEVGYLQGYQNATSGQAADFDTDAPREPSEAKQYKLGYQQGYLLGAQYAGEVAPKKGEGISASDIFGHFENTPDANTAGFLKAPADLSPDASEANTEHFGTAGLPLDMLGSGFQAVSGFKGMKHGAKRMKSRNQIDQYYGWREFKQSDLAAWKGTSELVKHGATGTQFVAGLADAATVAGAAGGAAGGAGGVLGIVSALRQGRKTAKAGKRVKKLRDWKKNTDPSTLDKATLNTAKYATKKNAQLTGRMGAGSLAATLGTVGGVLSIVGAATGVGAAVGVPFALAAAGLGLGLGAWKGVKWAKKKHQTMKRLKKYRKAQQQDGDGGKKSGLGKRALKGLKTFGKGITTGKTKLGKKLLHEQLQSRGANLYQLFEDDDAFEDVVAENKVMERELRAKRLLYNVHHPDANKQAAAISLLEALNLPKKAHRMILNHEGRNAAEVDDFVKHVMQKMRSA